MTLANPLEVSPRCSRSAADRLTRIDCGGFYIGLSPVRSEAVASA